MSRARTTTTSATAVANDQVAASVRDLSKRFGSRIVLSGLSEYVRDVVEITQLHHVFDIFDSSDAAEFALSA